MAVSPPLYAITADISAKWTTAQEKSIGKDYPFTDLATETPEDYVLRTYLQFLWLPESIMPLHYLVPSLLRVSASPTSTHMHLSSCATHPLQTLLSPLLLTPRSAAQKYHGHIAQVLADDGGAGDAEENMMWFALKYEKVEENDEQIDQNFDEETSEEKWTKNWLDRMERREVQIQIILHFLLLSLPGAPRTTDSESPPDPSPVNLSPSPKKRRHKQRDPVPAPPVMTMEECLESFMDKLSMWQLMASLDVDDAKRGNHAPSNGKGKEKVLDERDWMQVFCEDVVEQQFKPKLPELCALLRSKVFQDSAFSDVSDSFLSSPSPPSSPRQRHKRLKLSGSAAAVSSSAQSSSRPSPMSEASHTQPPGSKQAQARSRSRSLSVSLEEERARSRSLSVGPANLRKRILSREVSMTKGFKAKAKAKEQAKAAAGKARTTRVVPAADREKLAAAEKARARDSAKGVTLVAATPTKPKAQKSRTAQFSIAALGSQARTTQPLPAFAWQPQSSLSDILEGDFDDDEWTLPSSPDVLLLGSQDQDDDVDSEEDVGRPGSMGRNGNVLVTDTPIKSKRSSARRG
ncbi:hypothetical protein AcW1_009900 [Taiwanofungus camphoratus]|nr:hypothetical protein AcW1_009900 [Antrodia cinnamomea]